MKKKLVTILTLIFVFTMFSAVANAQKPGEVLVGEYTYYDAEGDLEYGSTYQWYRGDTPIPGATDINYTITEEDIGTILYFEVTPRSLTGISPGEPFKSEGIEISKKSSEKPSGLLPLPIPVKASTSTPVVIQATSTATTTIVTPTTPKTGIVSGNGSYVSPLDQKTYTCNVDNKPFNSFMRLNSKNNDVNQVKLWQAFLNADLGLNIPITGFFGQQTFEATKAFQKKYASEILTPWDIQDATGYFYKSTQYKANRLLSCSGMTLTLDNGVVLNY